jgi:hypothetical protein
MSLTSVNVAFGDRLQRSKPMGRWASSIRRNLEVTMTIARDPVDKAERHGSLGALAMYDRIAG